MKVGGYRGVTKLQDIELVKNYQRGSRTSILSLKINTRTFKQDSDAKTKALAIAFAELTKLDDNSKEVLNCPNLP